MKLFLSSHSDDCALFGSFTAQRERPLVLTVLDSHIQPKRGHAACSAAARRMEDMAAMTILGCDVAFSGVPDDLSNEAARPRVRAALSHWKDQATEVWLPAVEENGHDQHNLVGEIGAEVFSGARVHRYLTYTRTGGKSTGGTEVRPMGVMVLKKLQALACYRTQIEIDALGCWPHFMDMREFAA